MFPDGKTVVITSGKSVIINGNDYSVVETDHEEADTNIFLHLQNALHTGSSACCVRTVDTDVVVIIIEMFSKLQKFIPAADIWVAFGTGKHFTYYNINAIALALGEEKSTSLPVFHSFTGCDSASAFYGKG